MGTLRREYLHVLYRYQETHDFVVDGRTVSGQIVGVEDDGRLAVALGGELRRFGLQEIRHVCSNVWGSRGASERQPGTPAGRPCLL